MAKAPNSVPPVPPRVAETPALRDAPGEHTADLRSPLGQTVTDAITRHEDPAARAQNEGPLGHEVTDEMLGDISNGIADAVDKINLNRPSNGMRPPTVDKVAEVDPEAVSRNLLPGATRPQPTPLPPVSAYGTRTDAKPAPVMDPAFDRRFTIERLVRHPNAEVRQRAEEAQASLHHGASDSGILIRAAIDVARAAEGAR